MTIKKSSKRKVLTYEKALREIRKFAKKHMRFTNRVIVSHFKRKGYTHYSAMIGGTPPKYHNVDIDNAIFNGIFKKLRNEGVIDKSAKSSRRWDSLVFEGNR